MKENEELNSEFLEEEEEEETKWDYTSSKDTMITGAAVVGANLLVIITFILYKYVPAVHQLISGKPI